MHERWRRSPSSSASSGTRSSSASAPRMSPSSAFAYAGLNGLGPGFRIAPASPAGTPGAGAAEMAAPFGTTRVGSLQDANSRAKPRIVVERVMSTSSNGYSAAFESGGDPTGRSPRDAGASGTVDPAGTILPVHRQDMATRHSYRSIRYGTETLAPGLSLPRHRHIGAYATVVLEGTFCEASFSGRTTVRPGDVLLHGS